MEYVAGSRRISGITKMGLKMCFMCGWIEMSHDNSVERPVNTTWTFALFKRQYYYLLAGSQPTSHEGLCFMKLVFSNLFCTVLAEMCNIMNGLTMKPITNKCIILC